MSAKLEIYIADHSPLFRQGVYQLLSQWRVAPEVHELADFSSLSSAVARRKSLSLLLVDACLPGLTDFNQLTRLQTRQGVRVLIMAAFSDADFVNQAQHQGIDGLINKCASPARFLSVVESIVDGGRCFWPDEDPQFGSRPTVRLSRRQREVLALLKAGMMNKQIAVELAISENTVKYHVGRIYRRFNMDANRVKLARSA